MAAEPVDPRTAREMQKAGDTVVDVREPAEFAAGHIVGAVNIPLDRLRPDALPPGQILTACSTGRRATRAAEMLDRAGIPAFVIAGGTKAWAAARLPVVRD
jgi:rhodanese-related sulfurtransferase